MTSAYAPNVPPPTLRSRLREAREWRGLEQIDVARELGIGRTTVSNYERGVTEPNKLVVNAWAVVCEVDVEWLKTGATPAPDGPDDGLESRSLDYRGATTAKVTPLRSMLVAA